MQRMKAWFNSPVRPMSRLSVALWILFGWSVAYVVSPRPLQLSSLWLWVLILAAVVSCWLITNVEAELAQSDWYSVYVMLEDTGVTYCTGKFDYDGAVECHEDLEDWLWLMASKHGHDRHALPISTGILVHVGDHDDFYGSLAIEADALF